MSPPGTDLPDGRVEELNIAAWSQRGSTRQWPAFIAAFAGELAAGARPEAARAFLWYVGRRVASSTPLPPAETLGELEAAINAAWTALDWGWVRLLVGEDDIRIVHGAWPELAGTQGAEAWPDTAAAILEGVYAAWFEAHGSPLGRTEKVSARAGALEFRHGL